MATITSLGFSISSRYNGDGVRAARRDLAGLRDSAFSANQGFSLLRNDAANATAAFARLGDGARLARQGFVDARTSMQSASQGLNTVRNDSLRTGSAFTSLRGSAQGASQGMAGLRNDSMQANQGLAGLRTSAQNANSGLAGLRSGAQGTSQGLNVLRNDSMQTHAGFVQLGQGARQAGDGFAGLRNGAQGISANLAGTRVSAQQLAQAFAGLRGGTQGTSANLAGIRVSAQQAAQAMAALRDRTQSTSTTINNTRGPVAGLLHGLGRLGSSASGTATRWMQFDRALDRSTKRLALAKVASLAMIPALIQLSPVIGTVIGAFGAMAGAAGASLGIFGMAMKGAIDRAVGFNSSLGNVYKELVQAKTALAQMTPGTKHYSKQLEKVKKFQDQYNHALKAAKPAQREFFGAMVKGNDAWQDFITHTQDRTLGIAATVVEALAVAVRQLMPAFDAVFPSMKRLADAFKAWVHDGGFERFIDNIVKYGTPSVEALTRAGRSMMTVLGEAFRAFAPLGASLANELMRGAASLAAWAEGGGFERFIKLAVERGPEAKELLRALGGAIKTIWEAFKGLGPLALEFITALVKIVAALPPSMIQALVLAFVAWKLALTGLMIIQIITRLVGAFSAALRILRGLCLATRIQVAALMVQTAAHTVATKAAAAATAVHTAATKLFLAATWASAANTAKATVATIAHGVATKAAAIGTRLWAAAMFFLNGAFLTSPIFWVVAAIMLLVAAIVLIATKTTWFQTAWKYTWNFVKTVASAVWQWLQMAWDKFLNAMRAVWNKISGPLKTAWDAVWGGMKTAAEAVWNALKTAWAAVWNAMKTAWNSFITPIKESWNKIWPELKEVARVVWGKLQTAWDVLWAAIKIAWEVFVAVFVPVFKALWTGIVEVAKVVWEVLKVAWNVLWTAIKAAWEVFVAVFVPVFKALWTGIVGVAKAIWEGLKAAWNVLWNVITAVFLTIFAIFTGHWGKAWDAIKTAASAVWDLLKAAWNVFVAYFMLVWNVVSAALSAAWGVVWNAIKAAAEFVWNALQAAWDVFITGLQVIWNTVSSALSAAWNAVWNAIKAAAEFVWNALQAAWDVFITGLQVIWTTVSGALSAAWDAVWNAIKAAAEFVWNALQAAWDVFITGLQVIWNTVSSALSTAWDAVWNAIKTAAEAVWNALKAAWDVFVTGLQVIWDTVSSALSTTWDAVWNAIKTAGEAVWNALKTAWEAVTNAIKTAWDTVSGALSTAWDTVWNAIKTAAEAIWNALKAAWDTFLGAVRSAWDTFISALNTAWDAAWNLIKTVAEGIWNAVKAAWDTLLNAVRSAWDTFISALKTAWDAAWNLIKTVAEGVWNAVKAAWDTLLNAVRSAWDTFINSLKEAWNGAWNWVKDKAKEIWDGINKLWDDFTAGLRKIWDTFSTWVKDKWNDIWNSLKDTARTIWNTIGDIIEKAVNGVIKVINFLISGFNKVASFLKIPVKIGEIGDVAFPKLANGGVVEFAYGGMTGAPKNMTGGGALSGYAPGRDTVPAILSRGEGVLTPEAVRGLGGPSFVNSANKTYAGHRGAGAGAPKFSADGAQQFAVGGMTAAALGRAGVSLGMVTQGEYSNGALSAGTHAGGGVVDLNTTSGAVVARLRAAGFAAWARTGGNWAGNEHIHAVLMNHPDLSGPARAQVASFKAGGDGLGAGGGDGGTAGPPSWLSGLLGKAGEILSRVSQGLGINDLLGGMFGGGGGEKEDGGGLFGTGIGPDIGPDITPGKDLGDAVGKVIGGVAKFIVPGFGDLGKMLLGLIPDGAFDTAFKWVTDKLKALTPGGFGDIAIDMGSKLIKGAIEFLVGKNKEKSAEAMSAVSVGSGGGGNVQQWAPMAAKALAIAGLSASQLPRFLALMQAESGGNPNARNNTDINARNGVPSQGLMQVIPTTFAAHRDQSLPNNILDPMANMVASARYIKAKYGGNVPGSPYALGTPGATPGPHLVGELGPEMVNFRGGETVTPASQTASIMTPPAPPAATPPVRPMAPAAGITGSSAGLASGVPMPTTSPLAGADDQDIVAWFGIVAEAAEQMVLAVEAAWSQAVKAGQSAQQAMTPVTDNLSTTVGVDIPAAFGVMNLSSTTAWAGMNLQSATQWGLMRDATFAEAETHMGTTMPFVAGQMDLASNAAWLDMNLKSAVQWILMRDVTFAEAETHMGTTMPVMSVTMQTASDLAWSTMNTVSAEQWTVMRDGTFLPFENHLGVVVPEAANLMNTEVTAAFNSMRDSIIAALDAGIGKMGEFITKGREAITVTAELVAAVAEAQAAMTAMASAGAAGGTAAGGVSGNVESWRALAMEAMTAGGLDTSQIDAFLALMQAESGGDPNAINNWDSNAAKGTPSIGLMQVIQPTFDAHNVTGGDIRDPYANMAAAAAYIKARYGGQVPGSPYARGTNSATPGWHLVGENGPELVGLNGPMMARFSGGQSVLPAHSTSTLITALSRTITSIDEFIAKVKEGIAKANAMTAAAKSARAASPGALGGSLAAALARAGNPPITQGPFSNGSLSAGTHSGDGVVDTPLGWLDRLIGAGFAAWNRTGSGWAGNEHIHAVQIGNPGLSPQAAWQVQDWNRGGSGLNIPGNLHSGTSGANKGWNWVGERGPELMKFRGGEQVMANHRLRRIITKFDGKGHLMDPDHNRLSEGCDRPGVSVEFVVQVQGNADEAAIRRLENETIPLLQRALAQGVSKR